MKFSKLKGLFFDIEEEVKVKEVKVKEVVETKSIEQTNTQMTTGETNEEIFKSLSEAINKANLDGFDYFEFAKILEGLKDKIPSEESRFQTAYTSGSVMGTTKVKLLETAQHYLSILNSEAEKFSLFYKEQFKTNVTDKEDLLKEIDEAIKIKEEKIKILNDEINTLTKDKTINKNTVIENQSKVDKVKNDFMTTIDIFLKKINSDIEKIKKYISE